MGTRNTGRTSVAALGVWHFTDHLVLDEAIRLVEQLDAWDYGQLWLPETFGRDPFAHIAHLAQKTQRLRFGTGIASIYHRLPGPMMQASRTLHEQTGSRFTLGLGVSHARIVNGIRKTEYGKPLATMTQYLSDLDESPYRVPEQASPPRVLAALGPRMLELAATKADGAITYWGTPEHTRRARQSLGPDALLYVEQKVILTDDKNVARELSTEALENYRELPNYRRSWNSLSYSDEAIDALSPAFLEDLIPWGDRDALLARIQEHHDAGADQVCIQPLPAEPAAGVAWSAFEALAPVNR